VTVTWSPAAETAYLRYLSHLVGLNPTAALRAEREISSAAANLVDFPLAHREARWEGLREQVLHRWKKLIVYRVEAERILIVAFLDARQDLSAIDLDRDGWTA